MTLGQIPIEEKSSEIPALKPLLRGLGLPPGVLITADAMHCQQEGARLVTQDPGGDYLFGLPGNQDRMLERGEACSPRRLFPPPASTEREKHHDRLERRWLKRVATTPGADMTGAEGVQATLGTPVSVLDAC